MRFDGRTYEPAFDRSRLRSQLLRVTALMADGQWRTLETIARHVEGSEAGVSARLRDLRKPRFGGLNIERRRFAGGLHEYRMGIHPQFKKEAS